MKTPPTITRRPWQFTLRTLFIVSLLWALTLAVLSTYLGSRSSDDTRSSDLAVARIKRLRGVVVSQIVEGNESRTVYLGPWCGGEADLKYLTAVNNISALDFSPIWRLTLVRPTSPGDRSVAPRKRQLLTDTGLSTFAGIQTLVSLDLEETDITDVGLPRLSGLLNLERLYLDKTKVTGSTIGCLKSCGKLKALSLAQTSVTDDTLPQISAFAKLEWLNLGDTLVTDRGVKHLNNLDALRWLNLSGTSVTKEAIERIGKKLPDCDVLKER